MSLGNLGKLAGIAKQLEKEHPKKGFQKIKVADIYSEAQPRQFFDKIEELAESLKETGQQQPIIVYSDGKGKFVVEQGERRLRAARLAGLDTLDCIVVDADNDLQARSIRQLTENIQRDDMTLEDLSRSISELVKSGITVRELARKLGKKEPYISVLNAVATLPEPLVPLMKSRRIQDALALRALQRAFDEYPNEVEQQVNDWLNTEPSEDNDLKPISRSVVNRFVKSLTQQQTLPSTPEVAASPIAETTDSVAENEEDEASDFDNGNGDVSETQVENFVATSLPASTVSDEDFDKPESLKSEKIIQAIRMLVLIESNPGINREQVAVQFHISKQAVTRQIDFLTGTFGVKIASAPATGYRLLDWGYFDRKRCFDSFSG